MSREGIGGSSGNGAGGGPNNTTINADPPRQPPRQPTDRASRTGKKKSRAALRVATLNMRGGGVISGPESKWSAINSLMRDRSINVLALQETHLTQEKVETLQLLYKRLRIFHSQDPVNPTGRGGVAVIVNKHNTNWAETEVEEIVPGRALIANIRWSGESKLRVMSTYALSGDDTENARFWTILTESWRNRSIRKVDVLLGDLNMVENALDRYPARTERQSVLDAFDEMKRQGNLVDGWRAVNPTARGKSFISSPHPGTAVQSLARLDRIYVKEELLRCCDEWHINLAGLRTDHDLVSVLMTPKDAPYVGKGRSTLAPFAIEYPELQEKFRVRALWLESEIRALPPNEWSEARNIQTLWKEFKGDLMRIGTDFSRKRTTMLDKEIGEWEKRRETVLNLDAQAMNDDEAAVLAEIETNLNTLYALKRVRKQATTSAKFHAAAERGTAMDYIANREIKPRDTIMRLKKLCAGPTRYATTSKQMVEIATQHHEGLQDKWEHTLTEAERETMQTEAVNVLDPRLDDEEAAGMGSEASGEEVSESIRIATSGKAAGMDGLPAEVWKHFMTAHETYVKCKDDGGETEERANVPGMMAELFNSISTYGVVAGTGFADGWLCPIYKKGDKADIGNYRPVTVLNTDYKIMTRMMSDRLSKVVHKLVHPNQAGFIKGRSIFDQTDLIRLVLETGETEDVRGSVVCLNQEKAYDKIRHDFLWKMLKKFGIPERYISTIKHLYRDAETSVILNGEVGRKYLVTRGVRQGDPLSCLLFDLAIESLATSLRKSPLRGLTYDGMEDRILCNLFADDTTVFLDETDDFGILLHILEHWCKASGAKFNINKTLVIPMGSVGYRESLRTRRALNLEGDKIPNDIHIVEEGEPVRILGAWYGYGMDEGHVWRPIVSKIKTTLDRWNASRPTIRGRAVGNNAMVGGYTQYATRVQGMPDKVITKIKSIVDDFVWAKNGESKRNTVNMATLQAGTADGGQGILDLETRNDAIDVMRLVQYLKPPGERPLWGHLADRLLAKAAVKRFRNIDEEFLENPFTQSWRVNTTARGLPESLKRMMKVAYRHKTQVVAVMPSRQIRSAMPYWYHIATKPHLVSRYNDQWGRCQRENHGIRTTGEMLAHASKRQGCGNRLTCRCGHCRREKEAGCRHPPKCRANAIKKLENIHEMWDPREDEPRPRRYEDDNGEGETQREGSVPLTTQPSHPCELVRIFTALPETETSPHIAFPTQEDEEEERYEAITVYTDGSCQANGTAAARCGSGLWYGHGDDRNQAIRVGAPHPQTNNTGELVAVLTAIQNHQDADEVEIRSDSQYVLDIATKHANEWLDGGFAGVENREIVRALVGELILSERWTALRWSKVKGHSGDVGNDGADREANRGAGKDRADSIDLTAGEKVRRMGAKVSAMTQARAYWLIKEKRPPEPRSDTSRAIERVTAALEEYNGTGPTPQALWRAVRQQRKATTTQKFAAFAWKSLHDGHKIGKFFVGMDVEQERAPCHKCDIETETLDHILNHCRTSGQEVIWNLAKKLWEATGLEWFYPSTGLILGANLVTVRGREGKKLDGRTRLLQILLSESAHLIWRIRCEWKIDRLRDSTRQHTRNEIVFRWKAAIRKRLNLDWALTNKMALGHRALRWGTVERTWKNVRDGRDRTNLREDLFMENMGVLVGAAGRRRPPGRNR